MWIKFCDFYFRDFKLTDLWIAVGINYCGFYFRDSVYSPWNRENKNPANSRYTVEQEMNNCENKVSWINPKSWARENKVTRKISVLQYFQMDRIYKIHEMLFLLKVCNVKQKTRNCRRWYGQLHIKSQNFNTKVNLNVDDNWTDRQHQSIIRPNIPHIFYHRCTHETHMAQSATRSTGKASTSYI